MNRVGEVSSFLGVRDGQCLLLIIVLEGSASSDLRVDFDPLINQRLQSEELNFNRHFSWPDCH